MVEIRTAAVRDTPRRFLDLAWRVFFASRGRGVSLNAHFPWLEGGGRNDRVWYIDDAGSPAAMLMVREGLIKDAAGHASFHAIGLVCTAPEQERRGHASRLIDAALDAVGCDAPVLLWTSQHGFYARFGFRLLDPTLVATCDFVTSDRHGSAIEDRLGEARHSTCFGGPTGLPTFVDDMRWLGPVDHPETSFLLSAGPVPAVLEMVGPAPSAATAITALGVDRVIVNLPRYGPLIKELERHGATVTARSTGIAMWRVGGYDVDRIARWDISLLDRF